MGREEREEFVQKYKIVNKASRYTAPKGTAQTFDKRMDENPGIIKRTSKRLAKKGVIISIAALLLATGVPVVINKVHDKQTNPNPIEEVIIDENNLEQLGINKEDYQELEKIKKELEENKEQKGTQIEDYQERLKELAINIGKSKIVSSLDNNVNADRINLIYNEETDLSPAWQAIVIKDESSQYENYEADGIGYLDYVCASIPEAQHKIDDKISGYINSIGCLQLKEKPTIDDLNDAINSIEKFSQYKIEFKDGDFYAGIDTNRKFINNSQSDIDER